VKERALKISPFGATAVAHVLFPIILAHRANPFVANGTKRLFSPIDGCPLSPFQIIANLRPFCQLGSLYEAKTLFIIFSTKG